MITLVPTELNNILRREQLVTAIKSGRLSATSIFSGIGTLDCALQDGFAQHGLELNTLVANDCWDKATTGYLSNLQNMHSGASVVSHTVGIEQLIAGQAVDLSNTDLLVAGLVCKGASKLNVATRDLPESHREAGHQFINVLMLMAQSGFSVPMLLVENVVPYTSTIGYMLLCRVLEEQGYQCVLVGDHSGTAYDGINGHAYGDFERRKRMCLLVLPSGVEFEQSGLEKYKSINQRTIAQIREPECMIDQKDYTKGQNLFSEKKRSKGWRTKIVQDTETSTHVLSAQCYKQRSEDPRFAHPEGEGSRIPTVIEHARLKGHPESMIDALPLQTHAHEALGNGVMRKAFVAVGAVIAQNMKRWACID
ncbi:hypothetical protein [Photobacterium leiognathi]|uniref:hypothetical protein n=1 Tax=Photobacterium leiognathi TaxID=553611 RepID=UPI0029816A62|nr:hypothetical protein [Photobacterium leiognathi]